MDEIKLTFSLEKETPNKLRYKEDERPGEPKVLEQVYITKHIAQRLGPKVAITITKGGS